MQNIPQVKNKKTTKKMPAVKSLSTVVDADSVPAMNNGDIDISSQLVLRKDDYELIISYLRNGFTKYFADRRNAEELQMELKKATLVSKENFPGDVIRLHSTVMVREDENNKMMELTLVTPEEANIKEKKISFLAPIATALIGFREGQKVQWRVPSGKKTFTILEVRN